MRLAEIQPGMYLARDVYDPNGHVLMRAGARIGERHLTALKSWGIQEVAVRLEAEEAEEPTRASASEEAIRTLLDHQFSLSNREHPVVQALYDLCLDRALSKHA